VEVRAVKARIFCLKSRNAVFILGAFLAISLANPPISNAEESESALEPERGEDKSAVVYVIDKSSSMRWIYDELKETLKEAITKSRPGDSLSVVLFGDSVTTLASYRSMNESKKKTVSRLLDAVSPDSFYTNLELAIKRGTESLYNYFKDDVADNYILVLVTDGKNNPSSKNTQDYSIEDALTHFPDFLPGKHWSLRYIVLEGQIDPELFSLVRKYGESFFDVEKIAELSGTTQEEVVEGIINNPRVWEMFGAVVADQLGNVKTKRIYEDTWTTLPKDSMEKFYSGDAIAVGPDSRVVLGFGQVGRVGLNEDTEIRLENLQRLPLKNSSTIKLRLENGAVWNSVGASQDSLLEYEILTPIAVTAVRGTVLRVELDRNTLKQSIAVVKGIVETRSLEEQPVFEIFTLQSGTYSEIVPGKKPSPPKPIPSEILLEWARWVKALVWRNPFSRINFNTVYVSPTMDKVVMGPLKPGGKFNQYIPLKFSEEYYGKKAISAHVAIDLPPGVEIKTEIIDIEDNKLVKNILLSIECFPFLKYSASNAYNGQIKLTCPDSDIRFTRNSVDLEILHSPPRFYSLRKDISPRMRALIIATGSLLIFFGLLLIWIKIDTILMWKRKTINYLRDKMVKTRLIHIFRARPSGQFVLRNAPSETGQMLFDLAKVSRTTNKVILGIGTDPSNPIILSHPSVKPLHCTVWASRKMNPTRVYIEPCSDGHLAVNGEQPKNYRQLQDKDVIEIGNFQFEFVDRQTKDQVRVRMNDNTVYQGRLELWDITQNVFYMTHISGEEEEYFLAIRFGDARYVHFYRDESERSVDILPHPRRDHKFKQRKSVTVTLINGKKLKGFVDKKYQHRKSAGVFLYPPTEELNIQYTYIPDTSIETLVIVDFRKGT